MKRCAFALLLLASPAVAAHDSTITLGVGAQYGFVAGQVRDGNSEAPAHQYGLVTRLKVLRYVGLEAAAQLDQDPKTQRDRLLSPRIQLGVMANVPTVEHLNLFLVGGIAAHDAGDLVDPEGNTTSFHVGSGAELFVGEHLALGADLRFRIPGSAAAEQAAEDSFFTGEEPPGLFDVWQLNFGFTYYL